MSSDFFNVLVLGDIVGKPGREIIKFHLSELIRKYNINFTIANGENSAGGFGITAKITRELLTAGVDVITTGNHIWKNKDVLNIIDQESRLLRPLNYPEGLPGNGFGIFNKEGIKVLVINLLGRVNLLEVDCPFQKIKNLLEQITSFDIAIVDFHAETTSEKNAMGWFLDGKVSAVVGTHTHIQTADERILPKGTAFITDIGMCGSFNSIIGMNIDNILQHFLTRMPIKFKIATENVGINGVIISIDRKDFKSKEIKRVKFFPE